MKKILVVFTGGTIGSAAAEGIIKPSDQAPFQLLQMFGQHYHNHASIHFDTLQPIQILSENLAPNAWTTIIAAIESAGPQNYDGIIVTHGTDTLAYTAAALSFYFHALAKPMLLVSSDYPLAHPDTNGLANFICAVEFIRQKIATGVFVPYRNAGEAMHVHQGSRLTCSHQLTGDFFSVQNKPFMQFEGKQFIDNAGNADRQAKALIANSDFLSLAPNFSGHILMIKPYPGLDYTHFNLDGVAAVLHDLYHSGTACATGQWGESHSLLEFIKHCNFKQIPIYLAPVMKSENAYQSTRELMSQGIQMIWNTSIEAAYAKLALAYGNWQDPQKIIRFLNANLADEQLQQAEMARLKRENALPKKGGGVFIT